jgi:hypothetical protein
MITPDGPSSPSLEHRLTARSVPAVVAALEVAVARIGTARRVLFRGRKLSAEGVINAILVHALERPDEELERLVAEGVAAYERILEGRPAGAKAGRKRP